MDWVSRNIEYAEINIKWLVNDFNIVNLVIQSRDLFSRKQLELRKDYLFAINIQCRVVHNRSILNQIRNCIVFLAQFSIVLIQLNSVIWTRWCTTAMQAYLIFMNNDIFENSRAWTHQIRVCFDANLLSFPLQISETHVSEGSRYPRLADYLVIASSAVPK